MNILNLPTSEIPSKEVLAAGALDCYSDIFPYAEQHGFDADGLLGDYTPSGPLTTRSPLWAAIPGVRDYYRYTRRDSPIPVASAFLQLHIVRCIDKGYSNLLEEGRSPQEAVTTVSHYVIDKDGEGNAHYTEELNVLTIARAARERRDDIKIDGGALKDTRLRLKRLQFEWLSATTILRLLAHEVITPDRQEAEATDEQQ